MFTSNYSSSSSLRFGSSIPDLFNNFVVFLSCIFRDHSIWFLRSEATQMSIIPTLIRPFNFDLRISRSPSNYSTFFFSSDIVIFIIIIIIDDVRPWPCWIFLMLYKMLTIISYVAKFWIELSTESPLLFIVSESLK